MWIPRISRKTFDIDFNRVNTLLKTATYLDHTNSETTPVLGEYEPIFFLGGGDGIVGVWNIVVGADTSLATMIHHYMKAVYSIVSDIYFRR